MEQQVQALPVKCPRCDSSNTKFCYYNNYSLSQPRYLCKACKRYWTRGGTLRNVPVGGGCRKNKTKVIKSSSLAKPSSTALLQSSSSTKTHINNPLLLISTSLHMSSNSTPYSIRNGNYDHMSLPQLGFSTTDNFVTSQNFGSCNNVATSSSYPHFGTRPTGLQQENMVSNGFKDITAPQTVPYGFLGLDDVQMLLRNEKMEEGYTTTNYDQNYIEDHDQIKYSSDPPFMWNSSTGGVWHEYSSNIGSSVPSLI